MESLVLICTGISGDLFGPQMVKKKKVSLSVDHVSRILEGNGWHGNKLDQLSGDLNRIHVVYKMFAESTMACVVQVLGILNSCAWAITSRKELRNEMVHLSDTCKGDN